MKRCRKCTGCGLMKPLSDYYKQKKGKYGVESKCKSCHSILSKKWRLLNKKTVNESQRELNKRNKEYNKQASRKWEETNKEKRKAINKLRRAIVKGDLLPCKEGSCFLCGKIGVDYHHYDYDKPLDIIPLCRTHHKQIHQEKKHKLNKNRLKNSPMSDNIP